MLEKMFDGKNGQRIPLSSMQTSHLVNTINLFLRNSTRCAQLVHRSEITFDANKMAKNAKILYGSKFTDLLDEFRKRYPGVSDGVLISGKLSDAESEFNLWGNGDVLDGEDF
jgi:hypothetical protein